MDKDSNSTIREKESGRTQSGEGGGKAESPQPSPQSARPALSEKQRRELWLYIAVSIVAVELLVATGAVLYGFMAPGASGGKAFVFPWLPWGAVSVMAPTLVLLLVYFADVGLFRPPGGGASEAEWQAHLPERMQRIYRIVKGAPVVVILLGILLLGAALMTLDGALSTLASLGGVLAPYIPHIVGAIVLLAAIFTGASAWLNYRTRRLLAEYEFRRQVLEKTGVIIVDKGSAALPPGGMGEPPLAITAGEVPQSAALRALPEVQDAVYTESAPTEETPADAEPEKEETDAADAEDDAEPAPEGINKNS